MRAAALTAKYAADAAEGVERYGYCRKRVPQDGRLLLEHEGSKVDLRLSSLPTVNGEKLAIRFLQRQDNLLQLEQLQFSDDNLQRYRRLFISRTV